MGVALLLLGVLAAAAGVVAGDSESEVIKHVQENADLTFRNASGFLKFPYLVPSGPYNQLWDWDSVFMGVGLTNFGSPPYLAGSMLNFLSHTNLTDGNVQGCITPTGETGTIYHAKPVVIQGAWMAAKATNNTSQFLPFRPHMQALLGYWERERKHNDTGLYVWHDQLESGADNLPTSLCPSKLSPCWNETTCANTLASADIMTFLYREHEAYALFVDAWQRTNPDLRATLEPERRRSLDAMRDIHGAIDKYLWSESAGVYNAYNVSTGGAVRNRVYLMAFPLWGGLASSEQAARAAKELVGSDMLSEFGIRSTSSDDPRYNNDNIIVPYSNWRGPVWVIANALLCYGLARYGNKDLAISIATRMVDTLATDLESSGTWHECYDADKGEGLAAPGFLSWNTLGADLLRNLRTDVNPFVL